MKSPRSIFKQIVAPIIGFLVFLPTLLIAIWKTQHGHRPEQYKNVYGLSIAYTSVLILIAIAVLAVAVAYIARVVYLWRERRDSAAKIYKIESHRDQRN